jgi:hypothetical protein
VKSVVRGYGSLPWLGHWLRSSPAPGCVPEGEVGAPAAFVPDPRLRSGKETVDEGPPTTDHDGRRTTDDRRLIADD